jgi:hypothetical protein
MFRLDQTVILQCFPHRKDDRSLPPWSNLLVEMGIHNFFEWAGHKPYSLFLLNSTSWVAIITAVRHCAWPLILVLLFPPLLQLPLYWSLTLLQVMKDEINLFLNATHVDILTLAYESWMSLMASEGEYIPGFTLIILLRGIINYGSCSLRKCPFLKK